MWMTIMCSLSYGVQFTTTWKQDVQSFPLINIEFHAFKLFEVYNVCNLDWNVNYVLLELFFKLSSL